MKWEELYRGVWGSMVDDFFPVKVRFVEDGVVASVVDYKLEGDNLVLIVEHD